jgi:hypothetical protein
MGVDFPFTPLSPPSGIPIFRIRLKFPFEWNLGTCWIRFSAAVLIENAGELQQSERLPSRNAGLVGRWVKVHYEQWIFSSCTFRREIQNGAGKRGKNLTKLK